MRVETAKNGKETKFHKANCYTILELHNGECTFVYQIMAKAAINTCKNI